MSKIVKEIFITVMSFVNLYVIDTTNMIDTKSDLYYDIL